MIFDVIGMIAAGFGVAGITMAVNRLTGRWMPGWALPAAIGLAMLGFTIYREYSWFPGVRDGLPEGIVIASAPADRMAYRPWTYLGALTTRFVAVDRRGLKRSAADADLVLADVLVVQRWMPTRLLQLAFDCRGHRRAEIAEGARLTEAGGVEGAAWLEVGPDDALLATACKEG